MHFFCRYPTVDAFKSMTTSAEYGGIFHHREQALAKGHAFVTDGKPRRFVQLAASQGAATSVKPPKAKL